MTTGASGGTFRISLVLWVARFPMLRGKHSGSVPGLTEVLALRLRPGV